MATTTMKFSRSGNYTTQGSGDSINYNTTQSPDFGTGNKVTSVNINIYSGLVSGTSSGRSCDVYIELLCNGNWRTIWSGSVYLSGSGTTGGYNFGYIDIPAAYQIEFGKYGISEICITQDDDNKSIRGKAGSNGIAEFNYESAYTACGAPTSVSLSTSKTTDNAATLSWQGASSGTENAISSYLVQYCDSSNGNTWGAWADYWTVSTSAGGGSISVALPAARNYRKFRVRTQGTAGSGYYSGFTESAAVLRCATPSVPGSPSVTPETWESGNVSLSWAASSATGAKIEKYYIEYSSKPYGGSFGAWTALANTSALSYVYNPGLSRGSRIKYRVRAYSSDGYYSGYTEIGTVTMQTEIAKGLSPSGGWYTSLTRCTWTPPSGASYCQYGYTIDSGATWSNWIDLAAGVNSFDASALFAQVSASNYFAFSVRGVAANGDVTDIAISSPIYKNIAPFAPAMVLPSASSIEAEGGTFIVLHCAADQNGHAILLQMQKNAGDWENLTDWNSGEFTFARRITESGLYSFRLVDAYSALSENVNFTIAIKRTSYTDADIIGGTTRIKAAHMTELRERLDAICTRYGITPQTWAEDIIAGSTSYRNFSSHIREMQKTVSRIASYLHASGISADMLATPSFSVIVDDCNPKAAAIKEMRDAIKAL